MKPVYLLLLACTCTAVMQAQAEDMPSRAEFDALVHRVDALEKQLKSMSAAPRADTTGALRVPLSANPEALAQQPAQWKKLEPGMSPETVLQYLGAPQRKMTINGRALWYYDTPHGVGSVLFTLDNKVSSTQEPPRW